MARNLGTLTLDLLLQLGGFTQGTNRAERQFNQFSRNLQRDVRSLTSTFARFAGAIGAGFGFAEIIRSTAEAERAFALLENAVRNNGGAAGQTAEQLAETASALQSVTTFGDEAIQSVQTLLLSFQSIRGGTFDEATEAVLNLSTALGQDLRSSAQLVGIALEDPIRGMTRLARVGVVFTAEQRKVIDSLVDTGRAAEAQQIILDGLEDRFGNLARAARDNFSGALEGLRNAFGDLLEAKGGLRETTAQLNAFTELLSSPEAKQAADQFASGVVRAFGSIAGAITPVVALFAQLINEAAELGTRIDLALGREFSESDPIVRRLTVAQEKVDDLQKQIEEFNRIEAENPFRFWLEAIPLQLRNAERELAQLQSQISQGGPRARFRNAPAAQVAAPLSQDEIAALEKIEEGAKSATQRLDEAVEALIRLQERAKGTQFEIDADEFAAEVKRLKAEIEKPVKSAGLSAAQREIQSATQSVQGQIQALRDEAAALTLTGDALFEYQLTQAALTGELGKTADAQARLTQEWRDAHAALVDAQDDRLIVEGFADIEQEMLEIMGRTTEAAVRATEQRFKALREALEREIARGGEGAAQAQTLLVTLEARIDVEGFRSQADAFRSEVEKIRDEFGRREQTIQARIDAGTVSQIGGRRELINLHQAEAAALEQTAAEWAAVAEAARAAGVPIPEMEEDVRNLQATIEDLKTTTDELGRIAADAFETGLADSLTDLATGVESLKDAAVSFLDGINQAIARWASEQVAATVRDSLFGTGGVLGGIFSGGGGGDGLEEIAVTAQRLPEAGAETAAAAALTTSATALTAAGTTLTTGATGLATGATAFVTGATSLVTAATALTASAAALSGAAAALSASAASGAVGDGLGEILISSVRLAEGGKVFGPGTGTSDSIPAMLSAGEFVVKAAAVQKPGVQQLLERINDGGAVFQRFTPPTLPAMKFADGGMVPSISQITQSPTTRTPPGSTYNIQIPISAPTGSVSQSTQLQVSAAVARGIRQADARNN